MTDASWQRASEWLSAGRGGEAALAVLGAPLHSASISPSRADLAPGAIRAALHRFSVMDLVAGQDLGDLEVFDAGDLAIGDMSPEQALEPLSARVAELARSVEVVVILGGDNSVTRPALHGTAALARCGLLTLDAHFDLRDVTTGLSNGNPVRALLEDGLPGPQISQIGIQSFANSPQLAAVASDAGIHVALREEVADRGIESVVVAELDRLAATTEAIYVDFDIDVLDRCFAPAAPGSRPGGLTPLELRRAAFLCGRHPLVRAADIVEVSPPEDIADATVMAAAQVLLSFAAGVAARRADV